jgi:SAM-dependent methyltransferase
MGEEFVVSPTEYGRWRESPLGAITERLETELVFELVAPIAGKRVLDAGTGDGTYALEAARRGASRVVGVDADPAMLSAARARARGASVSVFFEEGRVEALPLPDASFDVVLAITVLCFVRDRAAAVKEAARVLAPGGVLVLGDLARFSTWAARRRVRGWLGDRSWRDAHFWSRRELVRLAESANLDVDSLRGTVHYPPVALAARVLAPAERALSRWHAPGAAFLALRARKPLRP